jgi:hypothetical protein
MKTSCGGLNSIRKAPGAANTEGLNWCRLTVRAMSMSTTPRSEERTPFLSHIQSKLSKQENLRFCETVSSWPQNEVHAQCTVH